MGGEWGGGGGGYRSKTGCRNGAEELHRIRTGASPGREV